MPPITPSSDLPGISGLTAQRQDTAAPLNPLAGAPLRGPSPLVPGHRESIAASVSELDETRFLHGWLS
ncbi:hypothetical protein ABZW30_42710 [Kitasatospora sp. NPDC004669]|uniref:hypothetical protein n=1 Tax=Kitasatospora sp. NPDC004669 TaxID=3154555 RepID=UPI0033A7BE75